MTAADQRDLLAEQGFLGPLRIFSPAECSAFLNVARGERKHHPPDWFKGYGASSAAFYEMAAHPAILKIVSGVLGDDIMLWGASLLMRRPGAVHPWHTDIETAECSGKTVSVWIGLEHTNRDSSLAIIPYSHRFGVSVQEVRHRHRRRRDEVMDDDILRWAQRKDVRSRVMKLGVEDGEALFFDGRLWHGSHNIFNETRRALLLQFATPDALIRVPDPANLDWPFKTLDAPRPPCVMVKGMDRFSVNRVVPAPTGARKNSRSRLASRVYPLDLPLAADDSGWKAYPIFGGSTTETETLTCHASALKQNHFPHPPHRHPEEEILLLLTGHADVLLPDLRGADSVQRLSAGEFVYYPAQFTHTIRAVSPEPANYLMFKWINEDAPRGRPRLHYGCYDLRPVPNHPLVAGFLPRLVFEGATKSLRKLRCHLSTLAPGAGYAPHCDPYDVAILVLEGSVETLDQCAGPHSVIFYAAGDPHGMKNVGSTVARYVVFEFHGAPRRPAKSRLHLRLLPSKFRDSQYWKRKLKRLVPI